MAAVSENHFEDLGYKVLGMVSQCEHFYHSPSAFMYQRTRRELVILKV